jgi:hypothetical protein
MIALHDTLETQFEAMMDQLWKLSYFDRPLPKGEKPPEPEPEPVPEAAILHGAGTALEANIAKLSQTLHTVEEVEARLDRTESSSEAVQMMLRHSGMTGILSMMPNANCSFSDNGNCRFTSRREREDSRVT